MQNSKLYIIIVLVVGAVLSTTTRARTHNCFCAAISQKSNDAKKPEKESARVVQGMKVETTPPASELIEACAKSYFYEDCQMALHTFRSTLWGSLCESLKEQSQPEHLASHKLNNKPHTFQREWGKKCSQKSL